MLGEDIKKRFLEGDYIIRLLFYKFKLSFWIIPTVIGIWSFLLLFVLAYFLGTLSSTFYPNSQEKMLIGTLDYPSQLIIAFFVQPVFVGYYLFFNNLVWEVLEGLAINGVIPKKSINIYKKEISDFSELFNSKWLNFIGLILATLISITIIYISINLREGPFWLHKNLHVLFFLEMPKTLLTSFAVSMILIRVLIFQYKISRIYQKIPTMLHPLHEDGAGGYSPIGKIVRTYIIWLLAGFGFYLSEGISYIANSPTHNIPNYLLLQLISLPIFAFIVFFWPLLSTREEMQRAVRRNLDKYSTKYNELESRINSSNKVFSERQLRGIDTIIELTNKIRKISPKWPFNTQIYNSFLAALGTTFFPLLIIIIEKIILPKFFP